VTGPFKLLKRELTELAGQLPDFSETGPVYLVGGSLRDRILNLRSNDYDFAVRGNARAFAEKVATKHGVRVVQMGKGDKAVYRVVSGDNVFDFSPVHGDTIDDDLKRRDFTINGLGFDLSSKTLIDPVEGLKDIRSRTIRLISEDAILADPLRMLRAFRLAAVLGFEILPQTLSIIKDHTGLIAQSAGERIRAELFGMAEADRSFTSLEQMSEVGLLTKLIPELEPCCDCPSDDHRDNVFEHVMHTYEEMEIVLSEYPEIWPEYAEPICSYLEQGNRKVLLRWAALLHDLGKPSSRSIDATGKLRYLAHEKKGALIARDLCFRLRMSGQERSYIELVVRNHLHPLHLFDARQRGTLTTRGLIRFVRKYEDHVIGLLAHSMADQRAKAGHSIEFGEAFLTFLYEIFHKYFNDFEPTMRAPRLITGKDLIEHFGLRPSELFGKLLQKVEVARMNREVETREEALKLVARLLEIEDMRI
jgi:putative nucleotidyltransferase with HDIG domain